MRAAGLVLLLCFGIASSACKGKNDADAAPDPAAVKAQQELIARRDALLAARQKLQTERDSIEAQIKDTEAKGGDTSDLVKKKAELDTQIESSTSDLINMVNSKLDAMKASGDRTANIASREAEIASREKAVADREARVAEREKSLVQRDSELAQRWKDTCAGGQVIIQAPPAKGGNYTKKEVSDAIARARTAMSRRGLLASDVPGFVQLENNAAAESDPNRAYALASQLYPLVEQVKIDGPFIKAKLARMQAQLRSSKVDEATNAQLAQGITDVTQKYGDGDYAAANRRLNQLAAALNK
ncbi:MAG: hypothetical protein ACM31C_26070 [Acidobacteriota bacterium]